jgi:hypothetical protein
MDSTAVTALIPQLREEQQAQQALDKLWRRYGHALIGKVRMVLQDLPDTYGNAEEIAMSAFMRFANRARKGTLTTCPTNRDSLQLLLLYAARDRASQIRKKLLKDKQRMVGSIDAATLTKKDEIDTHMIASEVIEHLRANLKPQVFFAGMLRFYGATTEEIARAQGIGQRTIERRNSDFKEYLAKYRRDLRDGD